MRTLIAEDDRDSREMLAFLLEFEGYEVVQTANGDEAWSAFQREPFGLVVSDWLMPEIDGLELCRRIRSVEYKRYPYIILLTALKGKDHFLEAMEAGADDFISKPFDPDELRAKLHVAERIVSLQNRVKTLEGILPTCMYCCTAKRSATRTKRGSALNGTLPNAAMPPSVTASALTATPKRPPNFADLTKSLPVGNSRAFVVRLNAPLCGSSFARKSVDSRSEHENTNLTAVSNRQR
jgi:CheY-like chemotaxis protein